MTPSRILVLALTFFQLSSAHLSSQSAAPVAGHSLSVNGFQMYYEVHGTGEPLVLLHGFMQSSATWAPTIPDFERQYRVIVPDLRGHGHSTNPAKTFTHRQSALDVFALLDELGVHEFKAMGISTGGMTLLHMATTQRDRVEAMVLIGATSYFPEPAREINRSATFESLSQEHLEQLRQRHHHGDAQIRMLLSQFHGFMDSYDDMNFTTPFLSTITARTLIVHGDRDSFFPVAIPTEMYEAIPRSYLWIIPNGGHVPIFGDLLPSFMKRSGEFLRGDWEGR
jgi:pimeloyl-ACP methyl ester carboxylesterase